MKIGIVTFHQALNYGAILQIYALQRYINRTFPASSAEVVNYQSPELSRLYSLKHQKSGNPVKSILKKIHFSLKKHRFDAFIRKNIPLSRVSYNAQTIGEANAAYDAFIVGSDQVWNPLLTAHDKNYLLEFADAEKRYAYAASVGVSELPAHTQADFAACLNGFERLSVREASAIETLRAAGVHKDMDTHIDPTLLLSAEEWKTLCRKQPRHKEDYVLIFTVDYSRELIDMAASFAHSRGLRAIYIGQFTRHKQVKYIPYLSIEDLLALFRDASYVFVNSFHGSVFSTIFHKPFYAHMRYTDGRNGRVVNLLEKLGMTDRTDLNAIDSEILWDRADSIIEGERQKTLDYLQWVTKNEN